MTYTLTLKEISPVTHDTHHLVFEKPEGFEFTPGQATDLSIQKDGWSDEPRPFTFIGLPDDQTLEFVIKSYPEHDGVTEQVGKLSAGDKVEISEPWGAIEDHGPGVFVAGGAGVTPFLAILNKQLAEAGSLEGSTLIFSNKQERDIIYGDKLTHLPGLKTVFLVTDEPGSDMSHEPIGADFVLKHVEGSTPIYLCGPDAMVDALAEGLKEAGLPERQIIREDFS